MDATLKAGDRVKLLNSGGYLGSEFFAGNQGKVLYQSDNLVRVVPDGTEKYEDGLFFNLGTEVVPVAKTSEPDDGDNDPSPTNKVVSDGGPSAYYQLPADATELNDLIEAKGMSFARGNIFKALYRLGEKHGTDVTYDLNKIEVFLNRLRKMQSEGKSL